MAKKGKLDPSRTTTLRRKWVADMRRRFKAVSKAVTELVVDDDAFGLKKDTHGLASLQQVPFQAWRFRTDVQKVKAFQVWLEQQIASGILYVDGMGKPWTNEYVYSAYKVGAVHGYASVYKGTGIGDDFYLGGQEQFLKDVFAGPQSIKTLELAYTRVYTDLQGVSATMSQQLARHITMGLAHGWHPTVIAREMRKSIGGLSKRRAEMIARTEVIYSHAEGQLASLEKLGIGEVLVEAEFSTAGDEKVCEECLELEGVVLPVKEAHGLIPRHPNCFLPHTLVIPAGELLGVSKRWYDGPITVLRLENGKEVQCTPNHPFWTTDNVFVATKQLSNYHTLCTEEGKQGLRIQDVVDAFLYRNHNRVCCSSVVASDFHGDGAGSRTSIVTSAFGWSVDMEEKELVENLKRKTFVPTGIIAISKSTYSGYVYGMETSESYYAAEGVVVRNCRCAWMPVLIGQREPQQKRGAEAKKAISRSIQAERPKGSFAETKARSTWLGKELSGVKPVKVLR